ncbi:hypothetical protein ACHAWF_008725 [Thalassiosira exigua]
MIHVDEFQAAFRSVNEKTSSSPSGIHYTFWKSMASDCSIASYLVIMMRMPFIYGSKNERWATSLDVMLEKKPGVRRIHQLRIIGLIEADFNTALKLYFARHLVANTETTSLTEEQWGGRPGRTAAEPALRKMLAFEYGHIMYVTIALLANVATACFNRMVPNISMLIACKSGMSKSVMQARNQVMASMRYAIRTSHGESHESFRQEPGDEALNGEGQGKDAVARLWNVLSHTLLCAHQELHEGLLLPHVADVLWLTAKNNDSFVDDTYAMASKCSSSFYLSEILTVERLEKGAQLWADLIRASGGSIALHKCYAGASIPFLVVLDDGRGAKTTIIKNILGTPNKGLGCLHAPSRNQDPEFKFREKQCLEIIGRIANKPMSTYYAHNLLHGRILPKTMYSMTTTSFSEDQCRRLNTIVDEEMLPKLRYN